MQTMNLNFASFTLYIRQTYSPHDSHFSENITDHAILILESVHVVGEIVLTALLCKYQIYLALSKATVPDLTYSSVRISR